MDNSKPCVLILDDEEIIRLSLEAFLEDEGFEIISAGSAEAGLEILPSKKPDIGIVDIRLPGIDGAEFILEAVKINPDMKFLMYTGSTDFVLPEKLRSLGISENNLFQKPLPDLELIVNAINNLYNKSDE